MIPADVLKFPEKREGESAHTRWDACGSPNRAVSLHFAAVNAYHSEGRYRMPHERALTKATHEDENQRRPFLGLTTLFRRMIPLCETDHSRSD